VLSFGGGNFGGVHHGDEGGGLKVDGGNERGSYQGEVLGSGSGNFGGFCDGDGSYEGSGSGPDGEVGGGNAEAVDIICGVVDSLNEAVGINVLVTSTSNSKGISGFLSGRVDVLVAETELTEFILGVKLAGGSVEGSSNG